MMKRALALLLSFVMIFSMLPVSAFAETSDGTDSTVTEEGTASSTSVEGEDTDTEAPEEETTEAPEEETTEASEKEKPQAVMEQIPFRVNPLYGDVLSAENFDLSGAVPVQTYSDESSYVSAAEAAELVRGYMKNRVEAFEVHVLGTAGEKETLIDSIFTQAIAHTGNATEGDYLAFQYGGYEGEIGWYEYSDGTIVTDENGNVSYTLIYSVAYYTTLEQEETMDTAVANLKAQLSLSGKSDYEKVCAVYDYITSNVTYDYTNLEDESYLLKYTAYAALVNGTAVCQGYANLFYRLILEYGIDARIIGGNAYAGTANEGPHAWNIVNMEGLYYNLDATWDAGETEYSWFLKCDANFPDHTREAKYNNIAIMGTADYVPSTDAGDDDTIPDQDELSKALVEGSDGFFTLAEDVTITDESTFNKGTALLLMGNTPALTKTITIADGGKLTISGSSTLVAQNGGSIIVEDGGELVVDAGSYLYVSSGVTVNDGGTLTNEGTITVASGGTLVNYGTLGGNGTLDVQEGGNYIEEDAPMEIVTIEISSAEELASNLADCQSWQDGGENKSGDLYVTADIVLAQNITIPSNAYVNINGGSLEISGGYTLTNNGGILVDNGKTLTVSENAVLNNQGDIYVAYGATLVNNGEISGTDPVIITTPPVDCVSVTTADELISNLAEYTEIMVMANITLSGEITIPENCYIWVGEGNLIIASDCTLTNNGKIGVYNEHCMTIYSDATVDNTNGIILIGIGAALNDKAGVMENNGTVTYEGQSSGGETESGDNLTWEVSEDGVLTIGGEGDMNPEYVNVTAPWCDDSVKDTVLKIVFEAGVTSITSDAFWALSKVTEIEFLGDAPSFGTNSLSGLTATAYYPADNETWTSDVMQNYGGTITWSAAGDEETGTDDELSKVLLLGTDGFYTLTEDVTITGESTFNKGAALLLMGNTPALTKTITIADGGKLTISGSSTLVAQNGGSIIVEDGGELVVDAGNYLYVGSTGTVENGGTLTNEGTITVASGGTLSNAIAGYIEVGSNAVLTIDGTLHNNSSIKVCGGTVNINGTYSSDYGNGIDIDLMSGGTVNGDVNSTVSTEANSYDELKTVLEKVGEYGEQQVIVRLYGTVELQKGLTIPGNVNLEVVGNIGAESELIVPNGVTLTLNGVTSMNDSVLTVEEGGKLVNNSDLTINAMPNGLGGSTFDGEFVNNGTFWVNTGSAAEINGAASNYGNIHVGFGAEEVDCQLNINGTLDNYGYLNVTPTGKLSVKNTLNINAEGEYCGFLQAGGNVQVDGTLNINGLLTVGNEAERTAVLYVSPNGTLNVADTEIEICDGQIGIDGKLNVTNAGVINNGFLCLNRGSVSTFDKNSCLTNKNFLHVGMGPDEEKYTSILNMNGVLENYSYFNVHPKGYVSVAGEMNVYIEGEYWGFLDIFGQVEVSGTLNNYNQIMVSGSLTVPGTLNNEMGVDVNGGTLDVSEGTYTGYGWIQQNVKTSADSVIGVENANFNYYYPVESVKELRSALRAASNYGWLNVDVWKSFSVNADITIPENVSMSLYGDESDATEVIISSGVTMTNKGTVQIYSNASLTFQSDSAMANNGTLLVDGGTLNMNGTYSSDYGSIAEVNLLNGGSVVGTDYCYVMDVYDAEELQSALSESAKHSADPVAIRVYQSISIDNNIEIPANVTVNVSWAEVVVAEGVTVTNNGSLQIHEESTLTNEGTLVNNNEMIVWERGVLNNTGTISGNTPIRYSEDGNQIATSEAELRRALENDQDCSITVQGTVTLTDDLEISSGDSGRELYVDAGGEIIASDYSLILNCYTCINPGGKITIGENGKLVNNADLDIYGSGITVVARSIDAGDSATGIGKLTVAAGGSLENGGGITVDGGAVILEETTSYTETTASAEVLTYLNSGSKVQNIDEAYITKVCTVATLTDLQYWLGQAESYDELTIDITASFNVTENVTIPANVTVNLQVVEGNTFRMDIDSGVTVSVDGALNVVGIKTEDGYAVTGQINVEGSLEVNAGGKLNNAGYVEVMSTAKLAVDTGATYTGIFNVHEGAVITNIQNSDIRMMFYAQTDAELRESLSATGYSSVNVMITADIELTDSLEIPASLYVYVGNGSDQNATLTVPATVTLTNNGILAVQAGSAIVIEEGGSVSNNSTMPVMGDLTNNGKLVNNSYLFVTGELTGTGTVEGSGFTSKQKEVRTVEQLQAALDEAENSDLNYEIYVTAPITLTQDVIIKNNVNMYLYSEVTVPEGISLTNNSLLALGSNLIVAKGGAFYDYGTCMSNEGYYLGEVYPETGAIYENGEAEHPYTVEEDLVENVWGQGYATVHEEYYRWTAEAPGTLKLSYSEGGSVSGLDEYVQGDGFVTVTMAAGDTVEFCVSGDGTESVIKYEASFEPTIGASYQYPIEITSLPYGIEPGGAHDLYYSYTAGEDFTLTVERPADGSVGFFHEDGTPISSAYDPAKGICRIYLTKGETVVIHIMGENAAVYTVRDSYVAQNSNGELYESVVEALAAAKKGETVKLLRDCGAEYLLLLKGITLDLNGYALTAVDGAVAIKGNTVIDSTEGTGILIVAKDALVLDEANTQLPVWTGSGYQFTTVIFNQMNQNVTGNSFTFRFKPKMTSSSIQTYLQTNLVNSGLSVVVRVTWKSGADTVCQDFIYGVETAQLVFVKGTLTLSVSGIGNFEDVTATAMVVSDAKVNAVGKTLDAGVAGE